MLQTIMPELLAIAPYPNRSADTRYRLTQFKPYLEEAGWHLTLHTFMDDPFFQIYNTPGKTIRKIVYTVLGLAKRLSDVIQAGNYQVIWLHKEAFPFGPPWIEKIIKKRNSRLLYDMDDAFWTHPPQFVQIGKKWRDPQRIAKIISFSDLVLAGNEYLADYARQYNLNVTVFPTVLDTQRYLFRSEIQDGVVSIGWVGRWSSEAYLESLIPVFEKLYAANPAVKFVFVGAENSHLSGNFPLEKKLWNLAQEIEMIAAFDIGIMPLPDDEYSRGKCGFKLLQYMALGIPSVASPVGVNQKIIQDGVNGFTASSSDEWFTILSTLVEDIGLRRKIGACARETVVNEYNLTNAAERLVQILNQQIQ
jgi:glycosyltransferase involved in cell wall biosynthesis